MMDHNKKLEFIHKMAKLGLQHFDGGGVISGGNSNPLSGISGALTAQNSYQAQGPDMNQVVAGQSRLAGQLQNEAAGNGPNPAQMQLEQNTQKIAQQQATANSQNRALNPGLAARMSSQNASNMASETASNAAIQQAQQQLASQKQLQDLYQGQANTSIAGQGINAQVSQNNTNAVENTQGGILKSLPIVGSLFGASGGMVPHMAKGGSVQVSGVPTFTNANDLPDFSSKDSGKGSPGGGSGFQPFGGPTKDLQMPGLGSSEGVGAPVGAPSLGVEGIAPEAGSAASLGSVGDLVAEAGPAAALALSKGGKVGPVSFAGKWLNSPSLMKLGGPVKASDSKQKAIVKDDSLKNDKVPAMLSEGEIVIPRHITQHPMAAEKAAQFVQAVLNKRKMGKA